MILLKTKLPTAPSPTTTHLMFCMPAMALSRSSWNDNLDFDNFGQQRGLYIGLQEFLGNKGLLGRRPTREIGGLGDTSGGSDRLSRGM